MESADSFFDLFNQYGFYVVAFAFVAITIASKNILGLVVAAGEVLTTLIVEWLGDYNGIINIAGQFVIYGSIVYMCRASKLIQLVYLFIMLTLIFDYFAWSYYETVDSDLSLNIALTSYYAWFLLLPFIYGLITKGLFATGGGKGYAGRLYNNNNRSIYSNNSLRNLNNLRLKTNNKRSNQRVDEA